MHFGSSPSSPIDVMDAGFENTESVVKGAKSKISLPIISPIAIVEQSQAGSLKALRIEGPDLKRHF
jgi:hypothetical protein